jgi:transcriptional regulator with XRE-family HTH domain
MGWSQERLAEVADMHRNFVGHVERGEQNVSIDSLIRFSTALKTSLADIFANAGL